MKFEFDFKGRGRMIVALVGGIVFIILKSVFPQIPITEEQTILFIGLIGAYILAEGISGKSINNGVMDILKSQKFQALVVGLIVTLAKGFFPNLKISDTDLAALIGSVMLFLIGAGTQTTKPIDKPVEEVKG